VTAVLIGAPGSGKSAVGGLLADRLGEPLHETDDAVAAEAGMPVQDLFITAGEERFRELEESAALALLAGNGIVVLGGGAVESGRVCEALAGLPVAALQVDANTAIARLGLTGPRSVLLGPVRKQWGDLLAAREQLYSELARVQVDTRDRTPQQVADEVVAGLGGVDD